MATRYDFLLAILILLTVVLAGKSGLVAAESRTFTVGSYDAIMATHHGKRFALVFWSVDCAPCVKELAVLRSELQRHPTMSLVLVSTDETTARPRVEQTLARHALDKVESWVFGEENSRRLRDQVDTGWYGELPRSYFYDARHRRVAVSGGITAQHLNAWLTGSLP